MISAKVKGDATDVSDLKDLARDIGKFPARMAAIVEAEVERERDTHRYQNRTGDAERSTQAVTIDYGDRTVTIAQMNVDYAVYLNARGFSRFDELMKRAEEKCSAAHAKIGL